MNKKIYFILALIFFMNSIFIERISAWEKFSYNSTPDLQTGIFNQTEFNSTVRTNFDTGISGLRTKIKELHNEENHTISEFYYDSYSSDKYKSQTYKSLYNESCVAWDDYRGVIFSWNHYSPGCTNGSLVYKFTSLTKFLNATIYVKTGPSETNGGSNVSVFYSTDGVLWSVLNSTKSQNTEMTNNININNDTFYIKLFVDDFINHENTVTIFKIENMKWVGFDQYESGTFESQSLLFRGASRIIVKPSYFKHIYDSSTEVHMYFKYSDDNSSWTDWKDEIILSSPDGKFISYNYSDYYKGYPLYNVKQYFKYKIFLMTGASGIFIEGNRSGLNSIYNDPDVFYDIQFNYFNGTYSGFLENSQTYDSQINVAQNALFKINLTYDYRIWNSVVAYLEYNGKNYTADSYTSDSDENYIYQKTMKISETGNHSFKWILKMTNSTGVYYYDSKTNYQNVVGGDLVLCNSTYNYTYINFTILDYDSGIKTNSSFEYTHFFPYANYSYYNAIANSSSYAFCVNDPSIILNNYSAIIKYYSPVHSINYYYFNDVILTNSTRNINLYLLNSSKTTLTEFIIVDNAQVPITNAYITVLKYDIGNNSYKTVSMMKTNNRGTDFSYLYWYSDDYKIIIVKDNKIIFSSDNFKIASTPLRYIIYPTNIYNYDKFKLLNYTLVYDNITENFILSYIDYSKEIKNVCLKVLKKTSFNDNIICNTCLSDPAGTIYCNIKTQTNGTYVAVVYAEGSLSAIDVLEVLKGTTNKLYNLFGNKEIAFYSIIFIIAFLSLFLYSPKLAVISFIASVILLVGMGVLTYELTTLVVITLLGAFILYLIKK